MQTDGTEEAARLLLTSRHGYDDDLAAVRDVPDGDEEARELQLDAMLRADTDLSQKALSTAASWSDYDGCTRLHLAAVDGRADECGALIALGAEPRHRNVEGDTALDLAALHGHDEVVRTLLRSGFNGDAPDAVPARTALHVASEHGQDNIVRILVSGGANLDALTPGDGETPLMRAAAHGKRLELAALRATVSRWAIGSTLTHDHARPLKRRPRWCHPCSSRRGRGQEHFHADAWADGSPDCRAEQQRSVR